jgi:hypothetical protein
LSNGFICGSHTKSRTLGDPSCRELFSRAARVLRRDRPWPRRSRSRTSGARQGAPQTRQVADRFHLLKNLRETIARQPGGFEAPIRAFAAEVEDDYDTPKRPRINSSDRNSETVERERLRCRRHAAAGPCSITSELSMTLAAPSGKSARSSALVADACIGECVTLTCPNAMPWPRSPISRPPFRGFPGTTLG